MLKKAIQAIEQEEIPKVEYSPVQAYLLDSESDVLDIERLSRDDLSFNIDPNINMDIVCENLLHTTDVSEISIEKILETSHQELEQIENSIGLYVQFIKGSLANMQKDFREHPKDNFHAEYRRLNIAEYISKETAFSKQLDLIVDAKEKSVLVEKHCSDIIYDLRTLYWSMASTEAKKVQVKNEIKKMVLNIRNFRYAASNKDFNDLKTRLLSIDTYNNETVTILKNNKQSAEATVKQLNKSLSNKRYFHEIMKIVEDPATNDAFKARCEQIHRYHEKNSDKFKDPAKKLKQDLANAKNSTIPSVYSVGHGARPSDDYNSFECWNGFQIYDLDIKNDDEAAERVDEIKQILHDSLSKYTWYMGIKSSVSGKGLHILTKVRPMHKLYKHLEHNRNISKFWFMMNYHHKFSIVKWLLLNKCGIKDTGVDKHGKNQKIIHLVVDKAMMRISQGILLNHDPNPMWSGNFIDLPMFYGMNIPPEDGLEFEDWILHPENLKYVLTAKKSKGHENLNAVRKKTEHTYDSNPQYETVTYEFASTYIPDDLSLITPIDESKFESGQRDFMRMKIIRTVIYIYGNNNQSMNLARRLLKVPDIFSEGEFYGKWKYAARKPFIFEQSLKMLKQCGCEFDVDKGTLEEIKNSKLNKAIEVLKETTVEFRDIMPDYAIELTVKKPYLGMFKTEILGSLQSDKVNVIEAAPGRGKTTLFNSLAKEYTVLLVCPYVSVLQNKIENDEEAGAIFDVCYGGKQVTVKKGQSVATTFDKFSRLTQEDYKNFDIIAIDESHLLFTSIYRDAVTTKAANNTRKFVSDELAVRQQIKFNIGQTNRSGSILEGTSLYKSLAKSGTKIVMMTGTITGELMYFGKLGVLNYIKVNSKHPHGKHATFMLCESTRDKKNAISLAIGEAINAGKTVICPTNAGDKYVEGIVEQLPHILHDKRALKRNEWAYYKKTNSENPICHSINHESRLPDDAKLLFCTVYLGVGVDILNDREYEVVFDGDIFTAQDIEQFNNRIRKSKIKCTICYSALTTADDGLESIKKTIYDAPSEITLKNKDDFEREIADDSRIALSNYNATRGNHFTLNNLPSYLALKSTFHDVEFGQTVFNDDKFIIRNFSLDYSKIAAGAAYTKYVLTNYYDYTIDYKLFVMNNEKLAQILEETAKEAKRSVVRRKADAFESTVIFCADNYEDLQNRKAVEFEYIEDLEFRLAIRDESDKEGKKIILSFSRQFEPEVTAAYSKVRRLMRVYSPETTVAMINSFVGPSGVINFTEMNRTIDLVKYVRQAQKSELLVATSDTFKIVNDILENSLGCVEIADEEYMIHDSAMSSMRQRMLKYADGYYRNTSEDSELLSARRREELYDKTMDFIKIFLPGRKSNEEYKCKVRKIPEFDSPNLDSDITFDEIVKRYLVDGLYKMKDEEKKVEKVSEDYNERNKFDYVKTTDRIEY